MKKLFIIGGIIVAAVVITGIVYLALGNRGAMGGNGNSGGTTSGGKDQVGPASAILSNLPTSTTIAIGTAHGTVHVNNFYLSNPSATDGGETVILANTANYLITYDTIDSSFWIGVDAATFDASRAAAEQAFLSLLGVSQADACKLNASVGAFYAATSARNGQSYPLSFCGQ